MNLPGYTIRRRLGAGGQAIVYLATQRSLDRPVALKVLHPRFAASEQFTARFLNEGRIVANLDHANVITIHDIGVEGELHFLSMELVEGGDLKQRIRDGLAVETILEHLITIADCLAVVHDKHIVHRDIKPENVLFRRDGTLVLTDFGIAKHLNPASELTVSGTTLGSPNYLSPEQARGKPLDGRADLYSLGAMAFEMFTGERPYRSSSEIDTVFMHVNAPLPQLPAALARFQPIIDGTMAKSPDDRFANASQLADRLADILREVRSSPVGSEPTVLPPTSQTAMGELARADRRDLPAAATTRIAYPLVSTADLTRTEGTRLPLVIVAVMSLFLVATWLNLPLDGGVETAAVQRPPLRPPSPAPRAESTPPPAAPGEPVSSPPQGDLQVAQLLARGDEALADLRLTRPRDDNALGYYRQVLAIDGDNVRALDGQRRVAARYAALATTALEERQLDRAGVLVRRGLRAQPSNIDLRTLQAKLRRARSTTLAASSPDAPVTTSSGSGDGPELPPREMYN